MEKIKEAYDTFAPVYEELMKKPYQKFYRERVKRILKEFIRENSKVLDIGCGCGFPSIYLAQEIGCSVEGIDVSREMIKKAKENLPKGIKNKIDYEVLSTTSLYAFNDESFDNVVSIYGALNYIGNLEEVLKEIRRIMKREGIFLASLYSRYSYARLRDEKYLQILSKEEKFYPHYIGDKKLKIKLYDSRELSSSIGKYFSIIRMEGICFIPFLLQLENSKELIDKLKNYIKLEENLAKKEPFIDLGMDILIVGKRE
jgi:ubiquinone/menaquinone biosynthesis C-methylase UbiE